MFNPFEVEGNWYKGNIHTHTTNSDGEFSPEKVIEGYKKKNYDFLAITDHNKVTDVEEYSREDFLLVPGIEIDVGKNSVGNTYHLVGINVKEGFEASPEFRAKLGAQEGIDFLKEKGGEAILAHPYWSGSTMEDLFPLKGQLGIEVYNSTCLKGIGKGLSSVYWDALLAKGRLNWGFAVDDAHFHYADGYRGWIIVKAPALDKESIISSIKKGLFYSSTGPRIKEINFDGKRVCILTSSPVKVINFICDNARGRSIWKENGKEFLEAEYELKGKEKYLRVECIDKNGETAWTNPLFFRD